MQKTLVGWLLLPMLFLGAWLAHQEAVFTRQLAAAKTAMATLRVDHARAPIEPDAEPVLVRWLFPTFALHGEARRQQAWQDYWDGTLSAAPVGAGDRKTDPTILLIRANATYRAALNDAMRTPAERFDPAMEAYAEVLRADPGNADAAYNYEYVIRHRDELARQVGKPVFKRAGDQGAAPKVAETVNSTDLPVGPTVHGWPGGPPPQGEMRKFNTVVPMRSDERKELTPGLGPETKRRG
jgi:hypothetical protein